MTMTMTMMVLDGTRGNRNKKEWAGSDKEIEKKKEMKKHYDNNNNNNKKCETWNSNAFTNINFFS